MDGIEKRIFEEEIKKRVIKAAKSCYFDAFSMEVDYDTKEYYSRQNILHNAYTCVALLASEEYAKNAGLTDVEVDEEE